MENDAVKLDDNNDNIFKIDTSGLHCPTPIMMLSDQLKTMREGQMVEIISTDPGFQADIGAWCDMTENTLVNLNSQGGSIKALILKGKSILPEQTEVEPQAQQPAETERSACPMVQQAANSMAQQGQQATEKSNTILVFSNDLDKAIAAFFIANGARSTGKNVTMFFTFWGINILRRPYHIPVKKSLIEKMFAFMMPRGAEKMVLSKMHMGGMGTSLMKYVMKKKNILSLAQLVEEAQKSGIKLLACSTAMEIMGIKKDELIDGVEVAGLAKFLSESEKAASSFFV